MLTTPIPYIIAYLWYYCNMSDLHGNVSILCKKVGQTPLDCIDELKREHEELTHLPMTYAGRLDPLAEGVLVILIGDECMKKDEYLGLPKEYEVEILFGFATDTYDVMGKVTDFSPPVNTPPSSGHLPFAGEEIQQALKSFTGRFTQSYPPYSSRTVDSKPLYQWAREDRLGEIVIPSHDVYVTHIDILGMDEIRGGELLERIRDNISKVKGDFRQEEILRLWGDTLRDKNETEYQTLQLRIVCGSGVYVRAIAHELGQVLGVPALALKIVRTKVGEYVC
jgi:tRNA pseudouridine(55) synthase